MLYSDHAFGLASFLIDPLLAGALAGGAATLATPLVRWLTPAGVRRRAVVAAARAVFVERGVHHTGGRTGLLVYCALAERMAAVVADTGVVTAVPAATLARHAAAIDRALAQGGAATAAALAALGPDLAAPLPRATGRINELLTRSTTTSAEAALVIAGAVGGWPRSRWLRSPCGAGLARPGGGDSYSGGGGTAAAARAAAAVTAARSSS
jgi:AcrR family transcriptional regulator